MHEFRDNQKLDLGGFAAMVNREFKMCPPRWKLNRARNAALLHIHGDEEAQFRLLMDYGQELRKTNPGSKFFLTTNSVHDPESQEPKQHLATLYWSYGACKSGFLAGCRPLIFIDGCHIKTRYKGQLLTAVGIDPNDATQKSRDVFNCYCEMFSIAIRRYFELLYYQVRQAYITTQFL